jgi:predicted tellurium resistance membrane protein TerC
MGMLLEPSTWMAFATLTVLETVLGIDNVIFISILVGRLPPEQQPKARTLGLAMAAVTRIALLFSIVWLTRLTHPWFTLLGQEISGRDLILAAGGLFLLAKSTLEIHETLEGAARERQARQLRNLAAIVAQIAVIDIVFSLDSVFTAVGLARPDQIGVMSAAIIASIIVMMWLAGAISEFVDRHPTVKILALAFLILVGLALVAEGLDYHIPKGYLYFAMAFSVIVEMINIRLRRHLDARRRASRKEPPP